jgi:hypothetical protein
VKVKKQDIQRIVAISNQVAEYPPLELTKLQYQALLILVSCIDSTEKPIQGIEDLQEDIKKMELTNKADQMRYMEQLVTRQNTYRIPYKEYVRYFSSGKTPRGGVIKRAMDAAVSLNNRPIRFNNPDYEGSFTWFQAVMHDKNTDELVFVITSFAKPFLLGLQKNFLQMLAESTMEFDGKYSVPIFLYMKSKLHVGQSEFHGKESLETFRSRFGLENIKTYDRYFELQRRILDVAERDSLKSNDIRFTFEGKSKSGSKKITDLHFHIYRIKEGLRLGDPNADRAPSAHHQMKVAILTKPQFNAYEFLAEKGVNKAFITDKILSHPKVKYEPIQGFEDIFITQLWNFFLKRTKAQSKPGAFVQWWKNGRLTREETHVAVMEQTMKRVKEMTDREVDFRRLSNKMTRTDYNAYTDKLKAEIARKGKGQERTVLRKQKSGIFKMADFRRDYPDIYQRILQERTIAYEKLRNASNYQNILASSVRAYCETFYNEELE